MGDEKDGLACRFGPGCITSVSRNALGYWVSAAAFKTHPVLFDMVRWVGAAYFVWIAWKIVRSGKGSASANKIEAHTGMAALQRGFLTNLVNPKAFMFCALLLPQFISVQAPLFPVRIAWKHSCGDWVYL